MVSGVHLIGKRKADSRYIKSWSGKVRRSQAMNEPPVDIWIITETDGTILSAHCLGCKAGIVFNLVVTWANLVQYLFIYRMQEFKGTN